MRVQGLMPCNNTVLVPLLIYRTLVGFWGTTGGTDGAELP